MEGIITIRCDQCMVTVRKQRESREPGRRATAGVRGSGPGGGGHARILPSAGGRARALPGARVACVLALFHQAQAPGYTLTTLRALRRFSRPRRQGLYKLCPGLGLQTIHSFIHLTNIY